MSRGFTRLLPALALLLAAVAAASGPASAQQGDDAVLPRGQVGVWSAERLRRDQPPGIDGAVAQVRERGEGRFAVLCERGDDKGFVAWRAPQETRQELRGLGDRIDVVFVFDGDERIERKLRWDEAGRYWTMRFGPNSRFADALKRSFEMKVRPKGVRGLGGDYTLDKSWRSIDAMFAMCRI